MATDILIVDDECDIRSLISMTLEDEGYATKQAACAAEARNLLLSNHQNWLFSISGCVSRYGWAGFAGMDEPSIQIYPF